MKKSTFAVLFILGLAYTASAQAQSPEWQGLKFGVKAGMNVSNITGKEEERPDNVEDYDRSVPFRIGYNAGVYGFYKFAANWAIQPEMRLSSQGQIEKLSFKKEVNGQTYKASMKTAFRPLYLTIPVLFKYFVAPRLSLNIGPQLGLLLDQGMPTKITAHINPPVGGIAEESFKAAFKTNTFDFSMGAGATYYL